MSRVPLQLGRASCSGPPRLRTTLRFGRLPCHTRSTASVVGRSSSSSTFPTPSTPHTSVYPLARPRHRVRHLSESHRPADDDGDLAPTGEVDDLHRATLAAPLPEILSVHDRTYWEYERESVVLRQMVALEDNYIYFVRSKATGRTAVVDPGVGPPVLQALKDFKWPKLDFILTTHHHNDHTGGNGEIQRATGAQIVTGRTVGPRVPGANVLLANDGIWDGLGEEVRLIDVPGHTKDHCAFLFPHGELAFVGDTIFSMGCGRVFDGTAEQLWHSLSALALLPPKTLLCCAHEYTEANARFSRSVNPSCKTLKLRQKVVKMLRRGGIPSVPSTVEVEKATNPFLRVLRDREIAESLKLPAKVAELDAFIALRKAKDAYTYV